LGEVLLKTEEVACHSLGFYSWKVFHPGTVTIALAACLKGRTHTLAKVLEPTEPEISFLLAAWGLL
jgi:hypothetical protein